MKRIAGELGVSITTVSKVLNNHADISEATRARVLAKVEELGYQRNAVARSLSLRRTHTLGIVIPDLMHSFFVEIIAGIEPVASARGYGLLLCSSSENSAQGALGARDAARPAGRRHRPRVGARLGQHRDAAAADQAAAPTLVMIDRDDHPSVKCHRVLTDDERVGSWRRRICSIVGRRAIAHIGGPRDRAREAARERLARGAAGARHQAARRVDRARRLHGERRLSRDEAAARRCGRASTRCSRPTIRRRSAR